MNEEDRVNGYSTGVFNAGQVFKDTVELISFERGGHGMVPELKAMRGYINEFLENI